MNVKLLTSTEALHDMENFAALAALTCHANTDKQYVPADVLKRIIKLGHESILEHINLTFRIEGLSRACLQELARHRHISLSVESTRHTLKKKLLEDSIENYPIIRTLTATDPEVKTHFNLLIEHIRSLENIVQDYPDMQNDELKYYLPEFWPTNLIITLNIREFRHILNLRTSPQALKEFRFLARSMFYEVPEQFRYLLQDCVHQEVKP